MLDLRRFSSSRWAEKASCSSREKLDRIEKVLTGE